MIPFFLFLAAVPALVWDKPPAESPAIVQLRPASLYVPAAQLDAWKQAGLAAEDAAALNDAVKLPPPGVRYRVDVASATRAPWIDSNGWRIERAPSKMFLCEPPAGKAFLAAAEAFAYGATAAVRIDPADADAFAAVTAFLRSVDAPPAPPLANVGIVDDGTPLVGEIFNLLGRKNILYRPLKAPAPGYDLMIALGSKEWPRAAAANPQNFVAGVRDKLGDDKRLVRLYGSNVVLTRLTGDRAHARLFLLNYAARPAPSLRVRVQGAYKNARLSAPGKAILEDVSSDGTAIEFSVAELGVIAVLDLD